MSETNFERVNIKIHGFFLREKYPWRFLPNQLFRGNGMNRNKEAMEDMEYFEEDIALLGEDGDVWRKR